LILDDWERVTTHSDVGDSGEAHRDDVAEDVRVLGDALHKTESEVNVLMFAALKRFKLTLRRAKPSLGSKLDGEGEERKRSARSSRTEGIERHSLEVDVSVAIAKHAVEILSREETLLLLRLERDTELLGDEGHRRGL